MIKFIEFFEWNPSEMSGITAHELTVDPLVKHIAQWNTSIGDEKKLVSRSKVRTLFDVNCLKKIKFQTWVTNPILVTKLTEK